MLSVQGDPKEQDNNLPVEKADIVPSSGDGIIVNEDGGGHKDEGGGKDGADTTSADKLSSISKEDAAVDAPDGNDVTIKEEGGGDKDEGDGKDVAGASTGKLSNASKEVALNDNRNPAVDKGPEAEADVTPSNVIHDSAPIPGTEGMLRRIKKLKRAVVKASKIEVQADRDAALLIALRNCRDEVNAAEVKNDEVSNRINEAKRVYQLTAQLLGGYVPLEVRMKKCAKREVAVMASSNVLSSDVNESSMGKEAESELKRNEVQVEIPTNPIVLPGFYTSGGDMNEDLVASHRDVFYQRLVGVPFSEVENVTPPISNANLKSKAQLAEWIYIARHWNTGADGMDAGTFRAKNKTWYSRMKPVTENLGRRTGIHLRSLGPEHGKDEGMTVLCRYNKDGTKSIVYLDIGRLYDAIFEIHVLELGHRGRDSVKNRADERYANVPDGKIRIFLETCPICLSRRGRTSF